jgi:hypothetical protein
MMIGGGGAPSGREQRAGRGVWMDWGRFFSDGMIDDCVYAG